MTDSQVIDMIYGTMVQIASSSEFDFKKYQGSWGYKSSERYQSMELDFIKDLQRFAKLIPVKHYGGDYYIFNGKIYVPVGERLLVAAYNQFMQHIRVTQMLTNINIRRQYFLDVIEFYNQLSPRRDVIAFSNGILDMSEFVAPRFKVTFHDGFGPQWHITYYHPYAYEENAKCRKWNSFLHEVLPDKNLRMILQMFLGLGLVERGVAYNAYDGRSTSKVELCLILIGHGANGKSTIYRTAMGIFGKERISGIDYDEMVASGDEGMRARLMLREAVFNWSSDSDSRTFGRKRSGVFKRIVSGEPVTDRKIGGNVSQNEHMPYLVFNLNELPFPNDQSLGFIRRLQLIPFEVTIPPDKQNKSLPDELVAEYPGIFQWIMRGCKELHRRHFVFPPSEGARRQVLISQLNVNPTLAWVNAYRLRYDKRVAGEVEVWMKTSEMIDSLYRFCDDNNVERPSKQKFGQTLTRLGFYKKHFTEGYRYQVFGCTLERLEDPFIVQNEDLRTEYVKEESTFIKDDD